MNTTHSDLALDPHALEADEKAAAEALEWLDAVDPPEHLADPELTDNAVAVLERRYLLREGDELLETPRQMFWRVATHVAIAELDFEGTRPEEALAIAEEFYELMAKGQFLPNSPTLKNAGTDDGMLSACFVLPVDDSVEAIYDTVKDTALVQKAGGGTGFDLSRLRPKGDPVRGGGKASGPMGALEVLSKASGSIQQGAFRQGANMGILRIDHPDVLEFLSVKDDLTRLENFNLSIGLTQRFLDEWQREPETPHQVKNPRTGAWYTLRDEDGEAITVGHLWRMIAEHAWRTGEPGLVFLDRIHEHSPIQHLGRIEATNPCGEQPLHPYDSCTLGSLNVASLVTQISGQPRFDWDELRARVHTAVRFLDDVVDVNESPVPQISEMSRTTRRIGLGVMGFADALFAMGIPYNSEDACRFAEELMGTIAEESHLASESLAEERGVFPAWEGSRWQTEGRAMRNALVTTVAPTGTISIIAGCSAGIEPLYSLAFVRQVMKDDSGNPTRMEEVHPEFEGTLRSLGLWTDEIKERLFEEGSAHDIGELPQKVRRLFVTAHDVSPYWHLRIADAFQKYVDAAVSKTINFPREATTEDVREIFGLAVDSNVMGVTVYRDGSRELQPMTQAEKSEAPTAEVEAELEAAPVVEGPLALRALPEVTTSIRLRRETKLGRLQLEILLDPTTGEERELGAWMEHDDAATNADLDVLSGMISLWLSAGGSLEMAITRFGAGLDAHPDGRERSVSDAFFRVLSGYHAAKQEHGYEAILLGKVRTKDYEPTDA